MVRTVGLVTIGQAPRPDLVEEDEHALAGVAFIHAGALDDLSEADVLGLAPEPGDEVLVSRLRPGREVRLSRHRLESRLQGSLDRLHRDADLTILLSTGEFPTLHPGGMGLIPERVLHHVVAAVVDGLHGTAGGKVELGALIRDAAQRAPAESRWSDLGRVTAVAASPSQGMDGLEVAGRTLRAAGAGIAVMDCIGYTRATRQAIAGITGVPAILANAAGATIAREILEGTA
jgi:protein AroM